MQSTGKNTDLCLTGNALFVVKEGQQTYYTRDGAFEFDGDGNYVLPGSGLKVQGWMQPIFKYFVPVCVAALYIYGLATFAWK